MQMQNLALARQEVVFDVEAIHRFEMAAEDCGRDQLGDCCGFVATFLDFMQSLQPDLLVLGILFVPLRNLGV